MNEIVAAIDRLADAWWTWIFHATWQASLLGLVGLAVVALGRRWPAPLRHGLLVVCLVKFAMPPMLALPTGVFSRVEPPPVVLLAPSPEPEPDIETGWRVIVAQPKGRPEPLPPIVPPEPDVPLTWRAWLLLAHAGGAVAMTAWILSRRRALRRIANDARSVSTGPLRDRFVALAAKLRLARSPRLLVSNAAVSPMAFGLRRPTVLVPAALVEADGVDLDAVLAHELAHVRRRDLWVNALQSLLAIVWAFDPIFWLLARAVRQAREDACDDLVLASGVAGGAAYGETLVAAASKLVQPVASVDAVACADRLHPLGRRLKRLFDDSIARRAGLSLAGIAAIVVVALVAMPGVRAQDDARVLLVRVLDAQTHAPLADARWTLGLHLPWERAIGATDPAGNYRIDIPAEEALVFSATVRHAGYVPKTIGYEDGPIPSEATVELERGTTMSGVVRDEAGQPVAGATVWLAAMRPRPHDPANAFVDASSTTDSAGRFAVDEMPAEIERALVRIEHRDYVGDADYNARPQPSVDELRAGTAAFVVAPGVRIAGTVVDLSDRPVAGAAVRLGALWWGTAEPGTLTDERGRFELELCRPGEVVLTVQAEGFAPEMRIATAAAAGAPVAFCLQPGRTLRLRVVDERHEPVAGAAVLAATWRGKQSLAWARTTNADGRVEWRSAPSDDVAFTVLAMGYHSVDEQRVEAGRSDAELVLRRASVVDGRRQPPGDGVVMAALEGVVHGPDGAPVAGATVIGCSFERPVSVENGRIVECSGAKEGTHTTTDSGGRFRLDAPDGPSFVVAFGDAGYGEMRVSIVAQTAEVPLQRWGRIEGEARIGSQPAAGDTIGLSLGFISDIGLRWSVAPTTADAQGRFAFERVPPRHASVSRMLRTDAGRRVSTHHQHVTVAPGATTHVTIGGTGRAVVGRLRAPADVGDVDWSQEPRLSMLWPDRRQTPLPAAVSSTNARERQEAWIAWHASADGRDFARTKGTMYAIVPERDGSFRVEDVPPGSYEAMYHLSRWRSEESAFVDFGVFDRDVVGGEGREPLDLGDCNVLVYRDPAIGDVAPEFEAPRFDGGTVRLSELRGKLVLVVFFGGADQPRVEAACRELAGESRVAIVGFVPEPIDGSSPPSLAPPGQRNWIAARLGRADRSRTRFDWGVRDLPSVFLVGPDGRLLAKGLPADAIASAVATALAH